MKRIEKAPAKPLINIDPVDAEWIVATAPLIDQETALETMLLDPDHFKEDEPRMIWRLTSHLLRQGTDLSLQEISIASRRMLEVERLEKIVRKWSVGPLVLEASLAMLITRRRRGLQQEILADNLERIRNGEEIDTLDIGRRLIDVSSRTKAGILSQSQVAHKLKDQLLAPSTHIPTGIRMLDQVLGGGLARARMVSIIAKYKIGKTTLLATIGDNAKRAGYNVLSITMERSATDIESMIAARELGINVNQLRANYQRYSEEHCKQLEESDDHGQGNIYYYHNPGATLEDIEWQIHAASRRYKIDLVLIDYYQLIAKVGKMNTVEHLSRVDQTLANLFANSNMACVIAAQSDDDGRPRDCKTLLHSAAANFTIRRTADQVEAWLENMASNYIDLVDAGSPSRPAMMMDKDQGPHFRST